MYIQGFSIGVTLFNHTRIYFKLSTIKIIIPNERKINFKIINKNIVKNYSISCSTFFQWYHEPNYWWDIFIKWLVFSVPSLQWEQMAGGQLFCTLYKASFLCKLLHTSPRKIQNFSLISVEQNKYNLNPILSYIKFRHTKFKKKEKKKRRFRIQLINPK